MAINWNQNKTPISGGIHWNIDNSTATLAHSQNTHDQIYKDRLAQEQLQYDAETKKANSAMETKVKPVAKGFAETFLDPIARGAASAISAPFDLVRGAFGKQPFQEEMTLPSGATAQSFQADYGNTIGTDIADGSGVLKTASDVAGAVGNVAGAGADALGLGNLAEKGANLVKKPVSAISNYLTNRATQKADAKAIDSLQQIISPKLDAKEIKLALKDGRIVQGRDPSLLRGGTPDTIVPSDTTQRAAMTIKNQIPGADKMKAPELHTAIDSQVKNMGASLRPVMETTPIGENTITKITNDWETLKAKQLADPYAPATANVEKLQQNFERNFLQKSKSDNFADLWDTRIAYDGSVPSGVKNATSLSSETLQTQKEIWLQNRAILNNAINDASSGLGEVSQKTFKEMNDMYNAQRGIESSFKPVVESKASKVRQFAKDHPYITTATGAFGVNKVAEKVGLPHVPTL